MSKHKSKLTLKDIMRKSPSKFEKEKEKVDKALMDYVVMPAKKVGGERGQAVGSGVAAGLSALHSLLRKPDDSKVLGGDVSGAGAVARKIGTQAFKRTRPAVARELKKAGEVAGKGVLSNMEKARIIRKFQSANPWWKGPSADDITGSNVDKYFKEVGELVKLQTRN